ncbi:ketopantoate reductase family protein [Roseomonas xinghualingensis]|uniref:ketopantoate reductase family protein n=1 Tax=Roseomonas xinghualingensis TaxID=2986475 RepID=UPI0021F18EEB|nr:ketopantoate reductase C-terminal domain-containing protein [Roseomonas sp. SXEYE001]MCV4209912.1 hypothetical protein [Roseomonas sp. SXEYE001]
MIGAPPSVEQAPVLVVGAGAVGAYIAGHLAAAGEAVSVLEPWEPNRRAIRERGLRIEEPSGHLNVALDMIDLPEEIPRLTPRLIILCTKLADAPAVVDRLEAVYRGPYLVTLNALADLEMAERLGSARVIGCIVTGLFANLVEPGVMRRHRQRLQGGAATFRLGEISGPATPRIHALVRLLGQIDGAEALDDLPAARWGKMVFNCMTSPLSALHGRPTRDLFLDPALRAEMTEAAFEVVVTADAAGVAPDPICGMPGATWVAAARGDAAARATLEAGLIRYGEALSPSAVSGMAQDLARGRRTEAHLINGAAVAQARRLGLSAPVNERLVAALDAAVTAVA